MSAVINRKASVSQLLQETLRDRERLSRKTIVFGQSITGQLCLVTPGGAGGVDHGVNHPGDEDRLAHQIAVGDDRLLHQGHLLREHVQPQVAAAHDDGVGGLGNALEVEQRLPRLALGHQL